MSRAPGDADGTRMVPWSRAFWADVRFGFRRGWLLGAQVGYGMMVLALGITLAVEGGWQQAVAACLYIVGGFLLGKAKWPAP